jgi:hypothetical protein
VRERFYGGVRRSADMLLPAPLRRYGPALHFTGK